MNQIFNSFQNQRVSNPMQMVQEFNKFRQSFSGNPQEQVAALLRSGRMTQEQYNKLQGMAGQFQQLMQNFR